MSHIQRETSCSRPRLNSNLDADLYGYRWARDNVGQSGATIYRLYGKPDAPELFLKHGKGSVANDVTDEMVRLNWLTAFMPLPTIVSLFLGLFSYTPAILIVGSAVWGVTFGGAATLLNTALADAAEDGADVAISMTVVSWNAAIALGGITGGIILQGPGVNGLPWVILILALVSFLIVKINSEYAFPHPIRDEAE